MWSTSSRRHGMPQWKTGEVWPNIRVTVNRCWENGSRLSMRALCEAQGAPRKSKRRALHPETDRQTAKVLQANGSPLCVLAPLNPVLSLPIPKSHTSEWLTLPTRTIPPLVHLGGSCLWIGIQRKEGSVVDTDPWGSERESTCYNVVKAGVEANREWKSRTPHDGVMSGHLETETRTSPSCPTCRPNCLG